jgi:hypothetical protein
MANDDHFLNEARAFGFTQSKAAAAAIREEL